MLTFLLRLILFLNIIIIFLHVFIFLSAVDAVALDLWNSPAAINFQLLIRPLCICICVYLCITRFVTLYIHTCIYIYRKCVYNRVYLCKHSIKGDIVYFLFSLFISSCLLFKIFFLSYLFSLFFLTCLISRPLFIFLFLLFYCSNYF